MKSTKKLGKVDITIKREADAYMLSFTDDFSNVNVMVPEGKDVHMDELIRFISQLQEGVIAISRSAVNMVKAQMRYSDKDQKR